MKQYIRLVCNGIANFIMLGIIVISIPITIPKLFQIEVMEVVSGSMEPELPIGCLVYCSPIDSEELLVGDIITYRIQNQGDESYFVTHRVVDNQIEAGFVETKGDANISSDQSLVAYSDIVGKVIFKIPLLGKIASFMHSYNGIYTIICLFSITIILWIIGDIIKRCFSN